MQRRKGRRRNELGAYEGKRKGGDMHQADFVNTLLSVRWFTVWSKCEGSKVPKAIIHSVCFRGCRKEHDPSPSGRPLADPDPRWWGLR